MKIAEEFKVQESIAKINGNIGLIYFSKKEYQISLDYFNKALNLNTKANNKSGLAFNYTNIGVVYFDLHDYSKALECFNNSLEYSQKIDRKSVILTALENIAEVYYAMATDSNEKNISKREINNLLNESIEYSKRAENICLSIGANDQIIDVYNNLAKSYKEIGNFEKALSFTELYHKFKDSTYSEATKLKIHKIRVKKRL